MKNKSDVAVILTLHNNDILTPIMYQKCLIGLSGQTYTPAVIAIDDFSNQSTARLLKSSRIDHIIRRHEACRGITQSLIEGISIAKRNSNFQFIAIHDADDYSSLERIEKQRSFLVNNPDIAIVGSYAYISTKADTNRKTRKVPIKHDDIIFRMYNRNPMIHGTIMFRSSLFDTVNYDTSHTFSQDYGLWTIAALNGFKFANIPEFLVTRCRHRRSITGHVRTRRLQKKIFYQIREMYRSCL